MNTLTVDWLTEHRVIDQLGEVYDSREKALGLLAAIDVSSGMVQPFGGPSPRDWWRQVCKELAHGLIDDGVDRLARAAASQYQGNEVFARAAREAGGAVECRTASEPVCNVSIRIDGSLPDDIALDEIKAFKALARRLGLRMRVDMADAGSIDLRVSFDSEEDAQRFLAELRASRPDTRAALTGLDHRDYWMNLNAEGPDGRRFALEGVRASTRVREIAKGISGQYHDEFWPRGKAPVKAVVDRVDDSGGAQRLNPTQTLHQAGVRPHDTLRVHPEAQAGAVDPLLRYESLVLVRNQIRDFARANPDFKVQANSTEVPNEYLFRFEAPSFAPGDPPVPIDQHAVFLALGPDFPMEGPLAFWQHPIFHPNVADESGVVCLGVLRESYRPGLHFGEVCQMLVDMAAYRNYVVHEGFNPEAAQWASSPEGQRRIIERGGRSLEELYSEEADRPITFSVRRVD